MTIQCPLSLLISFSLNSILSDIEVAIPSCFLGPFDSNIFPNIYLEKCFLDISVFPECIRGINLVHKPQLLICHFIGGMEIIVVESGQ